MVSPIPAGETETRRPSRRRGDGRAPLLGGGPPWFARGGTAPPGPWPARRSLYSRQRTGSRALAAGLGYGNEWCQRLTSPTLTYTGTGSVEIGFTCFNDTEEDYDYTRRFEPSEAVRNADSPPQRDGGVRGDRGRFGKDRCWERANPS